MVVGNVPEAADLLVVGAGPGGYTAALEAARAGRRVMLVDRRGEQGVGGVCLQVGCIPSKALIESAEILHRARHGTAMGVPPVGGRFDMARFQAWKQKMVEGLTGGVRTGLRGAGVDIVAGEVTLTEPNVLVVSTPDDQARFVQFKHLVLATGSSPAPLPDLPFDGHRILDSSDFLALDTLPRTLAVVGGGYIGVELGTAAAKLGVEVTIIEAESRLLPGLAAALARPVLRRLEQLGVRVALGARARDFDGTRLRVERAGPPAAGEPGTLEFPAEALLVAIGRRANVERLGLEVLRPTIENGLLVVGPDRRIAEHVAAIGDITPGPALAHKATAEATIAVQALCGKPAAFEPAAIPAVVFSDPEIATAGLTLDEATEAGLDAARTRLPLGASGRAATMGARDGFAEVVHDRRDGAILGVHIAGPHASELIAEGVLAIEMGMTVEDLALVIHPHPTLSEQIPDLARRARDEPP
jgi:dihydrolipoamide dehydrogenase